MVGNPARKFRSASPDPRTSIRRQDREIVGRESIAALLERAPFGSVATSVNDQPFVTPNLFWFNRSRQRICFPTASEGRTRGNIEHNSRVFFGIGEIGQRLPADSALEFACEYPSAIVFGDCRLVDSETGQRTALQGLLDKYFPELKPDVDCHGMTIEELERTSVFAIGIESWSGKEKVAAA